MLGSMSRTSIATVALLAALGLASDDAHAASRDRVRTEVRLFKVDVAAAFAYTQYWKGQLRGPTAPSQVLDDKKRVAWSATGRSVRVQATGRRGRWHHVSLLGGGRLTGEITEYDDIRDHTFALRLDVPEEHVPRWGGTCKITTTTVLDGGPSQISAALGGTLKPLRLRAGVTEGSAMLLWDTVVTDCPPNAGTYPGYDRETGIAPGEIDRVPGARRGCSRGGSFDRGWHQSCIATKRIVDRYGIAHTQTLDVEIVLTRRTARR